MPGPADAAHPPRSPLVARQMAGAKNTVVASHGRAPWYGPDGRNVDAYVIGIAGGSSSGKTSVARSILAALNNIPTVLILSQDAFYRQHTQAEIDLAFKSDLDLDHPDAIDMPLFTKCLDDLKHGRATEIPVYSFVHHQRMPETKSLYGASVIIVEGIMALNSPEMRKLYDLKVFVNCDSDLMLARRIKRDTRERGRDVDGILDQYLRFVKSSYDNFVQPSSKYADIIVPGANNDTAVELLVTHVKRQLESRSLRFRNMLASAADVDDAGDVGEAQGVVLLKQTNQLRGIMTILRDEQTARGDFIFYADRLSTIIVEKALTLLPTEARRVVTPLGLEYDGVAQTSTPVVGISILRSGGPFSHGLRRVIRDVPLGAFLIQSDPRTGEPLLLNVALPVVVRSQHTSPHTHVLLLDSQMGTGAAALMAIRVLLDHGVQEQNIIFLTYLVAARAVHTVRRAFPAVRIVTAAVDRGLEEMRFPLRAGPTNPEAEAEADGEADFGVRIVAVDAQAPPQDTQAEAEADDQRATLERPEAETGEFKVHVSELDALRFGRTQSAPATEKRAWVVSPGMGHIGDRYYIS
ncbi:Uridine kinase [Cryptotrichosporon argae]